MPHSLSSWLATSVQSIPAARSRSRYSSMRSGGTAKATWFIDPTALVRLPWSGRPVGADTPGTPSGASGNQKKARASPPAAVEEEVLAHPGRQLDGLDQRHAEHVGVEVDRPGHVPADQGQVVDAPELEPVPRWTWRTGRRGPGPSVLLPVVRAPSSVAMRPRPTNRNPGDAGAPLPLPVRAGQSPPSSDRASRSMVCWACRRTLVRNIRSPRSVCLTIIEAPTAISSPPKLSRR